MIQRCAANKPLVSVVMCVFRPHPHYLRSAVESVLRQSLNALELIVVEDPSEQSSGDMLAEIGDPRIRYLLNGNRTSLVEQRNCGVSEAKAEFVAILDCDDVAEPARLERQVEFLENHPEIGMLGSQVSVIDESSELIGYRRFPLHHAAIIKAMHSMVPLCQPSVMFRRRAVLRAGAYQNTAGAFAEDYELYSRLALHGIKFANHAQALTQYRLHPGQAKARNLRETIRAVLRVKERYWHDSMNAMARLRMIAERGSLWLPQAIVLRLLTNLYYRDRPPH